MRSLLLSTLLLCSTVHAGMPSWAVTDVAKMRLHSLSFFVVALLLSALGVKLLWNYLQRDFTRLPVLSYPKALALVTLWGLLFVVVLTMISGARELMTPGAWQKDGATYKLSNAPSDQPVRRGKLEMLRVALWNYADTHAGKLPAHDFVAEIPAEVWQSPDASRTRYVYIPGQQRGNGDKPLVYEPMQFGERRLVLTTRGEIREMPVAEIQQAFVAEAKP